MCALSLSQVLPELLFAHRTYIEIHIDIFYTHINHIGNDIKVRNNYVKR